MKIRVTKDAKIEYVFGMEEMRVIQDASAKLAGYLEGQLDSDDEALVWLGEIYDGIRLTAKED
jgi:hypothetical protein